MRAGTASAQFAAVRRTAGGGQDIRTTLHAEADGLGGWEHPPARSIYAAKMKLEMQRRTAQIVRDQLTQITAALPKGEATL